MMGKKCQLMNFAIGFIAGSVLTSFLQVLNHLSSCGSGHISLSNGMIIEQLVATSRLYSVHHAPPDSVSEMIKFMRSPAKRGGDGGSLETGTREQLFVGVLTQGEYLLTRAKAVYETWGGQVDKLVFFVGEDCAVPASLSHLPIVKLPGVADHVYPPLLKAFAVLQHMYTHHVNQFHWFVRADDDMYLRPDKLRQVLGQMDPSEHAYLGLSGRGRKEDLERLQLGEGERYCLGGPGIFMSRATLAGLGPHLDNCLTAVLYHNRLSGEVNQWNDDDVEIGRCLSRKLGILCYQSKPTLFHYDFPGLSHRPLTLWTTPHLRDVVTLHAIKDPANMHALHHFYSTLQYKQLYSQLQELAEQIQAMCSDLPDHMAPPPLVTASCDLNTHTLPNHHGNNLGVIVEKLPVINRPLNKFDMLPWKQFNSTHIHDVGSSVKVYPLPPTLRTELSTALTALGESGDVVNGYIRYNPVLGREYLVTLSMPKGERNSYRMFRPLTPTLSMLRNSLTESTVHTLLPLSHVSLSLNKFVLSYAKFAGIDNHLVVVVPTATMQQAVRDLIGQLTHNKLRVTVLVCSEEFNRKTYLEVGVASLHGDNNLLFVADNRVRFGHEFFVRCRDNSVLSERAYFPIPFSSMDVNPWAGVWREGVHRLVCLYAGDYNKVSGRGDTHQVDELWERLVRDGVEVMMAPDPGLMLEWADKGCEGVEVCEALRVLGSKGRPDYANYVKEMMSQDGLFPLKNSQEG